MARSKSKKLAKAKADKYFSEYIRRRDANSDGMVRCCTCRKPDHWKNMDAGHFISRRHEGTRYNEKNCHVQCPYCNRFDQGRQHLHGEYINERYGEGTTDELWRNAMWTCKRTQYDYEEIAKDFKDKIARF